MTAALLALLLAADPLAACKEIGPVQECAAKPPGDAEVCEICTLRLRLRDRDGDLAAVTAQRDEADGAARDLAERLARALSERDEAEAGARSKATWAWSLGVVGTVLEAGAVAVLLAGGSTTLAAALAGVGAASAGGGIVVAVW